MTRDDKLELIRRCRDLLNVPDDFKQKGPRGVGVQLGERLVIIACDYSGDTDLLVMRIHVSEYVGVYIGTMHSAFDELNASRVWQHEDYMERLLVAVRKVMVLDDLSQI